MQRCPVLVLVKSMKCETLVLDATVDINEELVHEWTKLLEARLPHQELCHPLCKGNPVAGRALQVLVPTGRTTRWEKQGERQREIIAVPCGDDVLLACERPGHGGSVCWEYTTCTCVNRHDF